MDWPVGRIVRNARKLRNVRKNRDEEILQQQGHILKVKKAKKLEIYSVNKDRYTREEGLNLFIVFNLDGGWLCLSPLPSPPSLFSLTLPIPIACCFSGSIFFN